MKQLVVITLPTFFNKEAELITLLFKNGLEKLHLRKPEAPVGKLKALLAEIPQEYHPYITLHDHFELLGEYPAVGGIHLNKRNPVSPRGFKGNVSCSCHSFEEIKSNSQLSYCFLSPIFNSISKEGYKSNFSIEALQNAAKEGILTSKVFALGGICPETLPLLKDLPFGGVAVLGYLWGKNPEDYRDTIKRLNTLLICIGKI